MEDSPQITVITPAYNVGPYIEEAMASVLTQSFSDFEYLLVNDGSTDDTADKIRKLAERDPRVHLTNTTHRGASNARNIAIKQARGEFVAFLDGDDRWHRDFLEKQLALLKSADPKVAAVFARARVISEKGRIYQLRWQRSGRYDFDDMLIDSCPPRTGSSLLIKKRAFDLAGLFDVNLESAQDLDMWLRIQHESGMPYFLGSSKYLLDIRVRPGAISRDHTRRFSALDGLIAKNAPKLQRHPKGMAYVRAAIFAYRAGEDDLATQWARRAMETSLFHILAYPYGWRLLAWNSLSVRQRQIFRRAKLLVRSLIANTISIVVSKRLTLHLTHRR